MLIVRIGVAFAEVPHALEDSMLSVPLGQIIGRRLENTQGKAWSKCRDHVVLFPFEIQWDLAFYDPRRPVGSVHRPHVARGHRSLLRRPACPYRRLVGPRRCQDGPRNDVIPSGLAEAIALTTLISALSGPLHRLHRSFSTCHFPRGLCLPS